MSWVEFFHKLCNSKYHDKNWLEFDSQVPAWIDSFFLSMGFVRRPLPLMPGSASTVYSSEVAPSLASREAARSNFCSHLKLAGYFESIKPGLTDERNSNEATDLLYDLGLATIELMIDEKLMVGELGETNEQLNQSHHLLGEEDGTTLGFNKNNGEVIRLFLRPRFKDRQKHQRRNETQFGSETLFDFPNVLKTLLHELAHNRHDGHAHDFVDCKSLFTIKPSSTFRPLLFFSHSFGLPSGLIGLIRLEQKQMDIQRKQHTRATASKKIDAESANARDKQDKEILQLQKKRKGQNKRKRAIAVTAERVKKNEAWKKQKIRLARQKSSSESFVFLTRSSVTALRRKEKKEEQRNVYRAASVGNNSGDWCAIM